MKIPLPDYHTKIIDQFQDLELFKSSQLAIGGIEVTQATQYYRSAEHLTDASDRGPDNSIRLIAGKPAWVRVYPWSLWGISGVTGKLEVQRRYHGFLWKDVTTLTPISPSLSTVPAVIQTDYDTMRGSLNQTLNFVIPSDKMIGTLRLIAHLNSASLKAEYKIIVPVTLRQTLRLAGIMISYDGPASMAPNAPNIQLPAPNLTDLQAVAARAITLFPVQSQAQFRIADTLTLTDHLQDTSFPAVGCGSAWDALHGRVVNARTADGNLPGWIYCGLLPTGVPMGPVDGCGGDGVAVGPNGDPGTIAHEAGHAAGLGHAPAGGAPNPDPNYPAYEPYDPPSIAQASIGEFGLDVNNGNIASPQFFRDFMAYGGPSWISPYHYGLLLNVGILNPETVGIDSPWWKDMVWEEMKKWPWLFETDPPPFKLELPMFPPDYPMEKVISLIVLIDRGNVAQVMHVARTEVRTHIEKAKITRLVACLRNEEGKIIAQAPLLRLERQPGYCDEHEPEKGGGPTRYLAQAFIPDSAPGVLLEINDGEDVLWRREAPDHPAIIKTFNANVVRKTKLKNSLNIDWNISGRFNEVWVRWSTDGENWKALSTGLTGEKAKFDLRMLPAGKVMLQLVAHDGFFSDYSKSVSIKVPEHPPEVSILHPVDGHTYEANQTLRLWGAASGVDNGSLPDESCTWLLENKKIAKGLDAWTALGPGKHLLTLQVDGKGGIGKAKVKITVSKPPKNEI